MFSSSVHWFYGSVDSGPWTMGGLGHRPRFTLSAWCVCVCDWDSYILLFKYYVNDWLLSNCIANSKYILRWAK